MSHYDAPDLLHRVAALLPDGPLSARDLAPLDQFHVGGLKSTEHLAEIAGLQSGWRVLDVGSGVGGPSRWLAGQGCAVTGLDLSADYVALSRHLADRAGIAVDYVQGDALDLPFADGRFDLVWTQHAAMNISDKTRLYAEMARALKPGGRLALHDVCAGDGELLLPVPWATRPEESHLVTVDSLRRHLQAAGFHIVAWKEADAAALAVLSRIPPSFPPLSLALLLGDALGRMLTNYRHNLENGRARVVEVVAELT